MTAGTTPPVPIRQPTAILPPAWADRLGETFVHLIGVRVLPGIGHFVPFEAPDAFAEGIRTVL